MITNGLLSVSETEKWKMKMLACNIQWSLLATIYRSISNKKIIDLTPFIDNFYKKSI